MSAISVRPMRPADAAEWAFMRTALWPEGSEAEHRAEIDRFFSPERREPREALLAEDASGRAVGFAELSIRAYAEGCRSDRVAYLEGWYVVAEMRGRGVGRALVDAAADWGRSQGCPEFGSDTLYDNEASAAAHLALGFEDAGTVRCFRKDL